MSIADFFAQLRQRSNARRYPPAHLAAALALQATPPPPDLELRWKCAYSGRSSADFALAYRGLLSYLSIVKLAAACKAGATVLPSAAADSVWHLLLHDTQAYTEFCRASVGFNVVHVPQRDAADLTSKSLATTWRLACCLEAIDAVKPPRLPLLFALDTQLDWPQGHSYRLEKMGSQRRIFLGIGDNPRDVTGLLLLTAVSSVGADGTHSCGGSSCGGSH
ncbi:MAG: hypothetical protein JNN30_13655 [Rhodanobacteraceae bacterium]|nr:hypothetical protein [Rhodanobacteraceae bacterium]